MPSRLLPYFRWYPKDAIGDENYCAMSDTELGFYHRCLNSAWVNDGLPEDPNERARLLKESRESADKKWERVGKCFVKSETHPGRLVNPRQEMERDHALKASRKGKKAAEVRHSKPPAELRSIGIPIAIIPPANPDKTVMELREIEAGFDRHLKHDNREPKDLVIQLALSMNGQFDWAKFRANHPGYCAHYEASGWDFCKLSFMGWIRAGMPPAPPKAKTVAQIRKEEQDKRLLED